MNTWQPITVSELEKLVARQLFVCSPENQEFFKTIRVPFYQVPIHRLGVIEKVFVVAVLPSGVVYYEDVEDGFEIQELSKDGEILNQGCNQLELSHVLSQIRSNLSFKRDA